MIWSPIIRKILFALLHSQELVDQNSEATGPPINRVTLTRCRSGPVACTAVGEVASKSSLVCDKVLTVPINSVIQALKAMALVAPGVGLGALLKRPIVLKILQWKCPLRNENGLALSTC